MTLRTATSAGLLPVAHWCASADHTDRDAPGWATRAMPGGGVGGLGLTALGVDTSATAVAPARQRGGDATAGRISAPLAPEPPR